ncbi:MAG: hypothetical protein GY819_19400, partial [Planctomycetaceae bacterium]|nr:hypothetical protein [Planctomycetaceae bacterium]
MDSSRVNPPPNSGDPDREREISERITAELGLPGEKPRQPEISRQPDISQQPDASCRPDDCEDVSDSYWQPTDITAVTIANPTALLNQGNPTPAPSPWKNQLFSEMEQHFGISPQVAPNPREKWDNEASEIGGDRNLSSCGNPQDPEYPYRSLPTPAFYGEKLYPRVSDEETGLRKDQGTNPPTPCRLDQTTTSAPPPYDSRFYTAARKGHYFGYGTSEEQTIVQAPDVGNKGGNGDDPDCISPTQRVNIAE